MKKTSKLFALVLSLIMVLGLCLTGCGKENVTVESLIKGAQAKAMSAEGMAFDGTIGMDMSIAMFGENEDMTMDGKLHCDAKGDEIAHVTMDMTMKTAEEEQPQTQTVETYVVKDGDKFITYTNNDSVWYKQETETTGLLDVNKILTDKVIGSATLEEKDNEYVVSGALDLADVVETVGSMMDMDEMLGELEGVDFTKVPKAKVVYHFDKKTKDLTSVEMDMSETMQGLFDEAINAMFSQYVGDKDSSEMTEEEQNLLTALMSAFKFECSRLVVNINNIVYGESVKVKLPDSVKESAKEMPDYSSLYDDIDMGESTTIANPMVEYDTIEEAKSAIGFGIVAPAKLTGTFSQNSIYVIADEIFEVDYIDDVDYKLSVRKALDSVGDISGDYNEYAFTKDVADAVENATVVLSGDAEDAILSATWTKDGYAYAILSEVSMSIDDMLSIVSVIQ